MPVRSQFFHAADFYTALRDWYAGLALPGLIDRFPNHKDAARQAFAYGSAMAALRRMEES